MDWLFTHILLQFTKLRCRQNIRQCSWQTYKEFISVNWKHSIKHVWPLGARKEFVSHAYFHCRRRVHAQIVISLLGARLVNHTSKASRSCVGYLHKAISKNTPFLTPPPKVSRTAISFYNFFKFPHRINEFSVTSKNCYLANNSFCSFVLAKRQSACCHKPLM